MAKHFDSNAKKNANIQSEMLRFFLIIMKTVIIILLSIAFASCSRVKDSNSASILNISCSDQFSTFMREWIDEFKEIDMNVSCKITQNNHEMGFASLITGQSNFLITDKKMLRVELNDVKSSNSEFTERQRNFIKHYLSRDGQRQLFKHGFFPMVNK